MDCGLTDRIIIITGAAAGIGAAIARLALAEGAGGLLLVDRDATGGARMAAELGDKTRFFRADLVEAGAPAAIAAAALDAFGRIDGLVNAAALTSRGSFVDGSVEVWDRMFDTNARAGFFLMQAAIADMRRRAAAGSIVNILSMNAYVGIPELAIYSGSKGAMATLTRNAAHAHMADRIRVNGINLGWVATPGERRMQAVELGRGDGWLAAAEALQPLGRLVTAEEAARLAVFLLGDVSVPMSGSVVDFEQKVAGAI
ncbi:MAG: oxidoreductase [bacterium]